MSLMLTDVLSMVANVLPILANESRVANQQKFGKIDEKIRKYTKNELTTLHLTKITKEWKRNYPISVHIY